MRLKSIHHIELLVGNAKQAAYYYRRAFGFSQFAYMGPETGCRDRCSYGLEQGKARIVLTTPLDPASTAKLEKTGFVPESALNALERYLAHL